MDCGSPDLRSGAPQLRAKVTFVFLLFEDVQHGEQFFGGKRVLNSSPLTYYACNGKIKQKRMAVQTTLKIDKDVEMLLALHNGKDEQAEG